MSAVLLLGSACSPLQVYGNLRAEVEHNLKVDPVARVEAKACLEAANNEAKKAAKNRFIDMALIVFGSAFAGGGAATTTASSFISDTHNGGQASDTKQWVAGTGAVATGIGAALLALRTALDLGVVSSAETAAAAGQAALAMRIVDADGDAGARDNLYAQCTQLTVGINSAYPATSAAAPPGDGGP